MSHPDEWRVPAEMAERIGRSGWKALMESKSDVTTFEDQVREILDDLGDMLIAKNKAYGNSALEPVSVFSRAGAVESLNIRIDDKLSRIARGTDYPGEDTIDDLIGYLVLLKIARQDVGG